MNGATSGPAQVRGVVGSASVHPPHVKTLRPEALREEWGRRVRRKYGLRNQCAQRIAVTGAKLTDFSSSTIRSVKPAGLNPISEERPMISVSHAIWMILRSARMGRSESASCPLPLASASHTAHSSPFLTHLADSLLGSQVRLNARSAHRSAAALARYGLVS